MRTPAISRLLLVSCAVSCLAAVFPGRSSATVPPQLAQPADMTVDEGATADQTITGTDPDGDPLNFFKVSLGPTFLTVTTTNPGTGTAAGNVHLAPGFSDMGSYSATVGVSDGISSSTRSFTITVNNVNRAPMLNQPADMICVAEGTTRDQAISGSDPDGDALEFSKVAGPVYMTVTTISPTTGNIHLAPGFNDAGTASGTVQASDGALSDTKSFSIRVGCPDRAPVLIQPGNMVVDEGATADQMLSASDPDGDPLTFFLVSGRTYMTVTTINPTGTPTGNIHLAPGFSDGGTASTTVQVSDGLVSDNKSFTITVNDVNRAPVLAQPANMTVIEGDTADQVLGAFDPDGDPLTFFMVSGPGFMTVTTTMPGTGTGTGDVHLAPGLSGAGTYSATVRASDGFSSNDKSFTIRVNIVPPPGPSFPQPANMTVNEGATADQVLTATDPDGDPLTFTKVAGPLFVTVFTTAPGTGAATGLIHLDPGFSDSGIYLATVSVSDPFSSTRKSLTITVNNVNRPPTANPGGPYSGVLGVPITFNGGDSFDPDGDPLTYSWTFGDGATAVGVTPSHTYAAPGTYTVCLTVTDAGTPSLINTVCTTVTIQSVLAARVFRSKDKKVQLDSGQRQCFQIEPIGGDFELTDVDLATIVAKYGGTQVSPITRKTIINADTDHNGIQEIDACFSAASLRTLFATAPNGVSTVTISLEGSLRTGATFQGDVTFQIQKSGGAMASVSPNPLNPSAVLTFATTRPGYAEVELFDTQGRLVRTILARSFREAGVHEVAIEGRGGHGEKLASGIYFIRGIVEEGTFTKTIAILK